MVTWNREKIRSKVRELTGSPSTNQLTDAEIDDQINTYYAFTMPFELKEQINFQPYNFQTLPNIAEYSLSSSFITYEPLAYVNGQRLNFYQDRDIFFQDWPQQYTQETEGTTDGLVAAFGGTCQALPILRGSFIATEQSQIAFDKSDGILYQNDGTVDQIIGTINYVTGIYSGNFLNIPAASLTISRTFEAYIAAKPQGLLFYNNKLTFRPIPDQVYQVTLQGFIAQTELGNDVSVPLQTEWGQLIAYGSSLEIIADRGDWGTYQALYPMFKRYENVALARYVEQFQNVQSIPRF